MKGPGAFGNTTVDLKLEALSSGQWRMPDFHTPNIMPTSRSRGVHSTT